MRTSSGCDRVVAVRATASPQLLENELCGNRLLGMTSHVSWTNDLEFHWRFGSYVWVRCCMECTGISIKRSSDFIIIMTTTMTFLSKRFHLQKSRQAGSKLAISACFDIASCLLLAQNTHQWPFKGSPSDTEGFYCKYFFYLLGRL